MGSSRALVCSTAFVLVLLSSASKDERIIEQREVTFELDKIMQEMQQPNSPVLQKQLSLKDFLDLEGGSRPGVLTPRGRQPIFGPRSFGGPSFLDYPVQFPLGRPTFDNLQAICLHGDRRPRYPDSYFPASGFGLLKRRASAVNKAESWFSTCCKGNQTWEREVTLCCATQAWEMSVESFCKEDSSVKDRQYECCSQKDSDRLNCFHKDAPNPNYEPTEELPVPPPPSTSNFSFDPNTCQRTVTTYRGKGKNVKRPSAPKKMNIIFPPGRPTADTIESLCLTQKQRPLYNIKCLPGFGYEWLARQAKAINRIEKGFKECCEKKQDMLYCAVLKWRQELNRFCLGENGEKEDYFCCMVHERIRRYNCFQNISPDPHYNMTLATEELSLHKICDTHKIIKKKFPVGFPLKSFVNHCCLPLSEQDKTICFLQKLETMSEDLCSGRKTTTPAVRRCCSAPLQEAPECISKILMDAITKATKVLRQKKKKICPFS